MFRASLCPSSGEKTTCYCIWGIFAATREDVDINRVFFFWGSVRFDKLGLFGLLMMGIKMFETCRDISQ